MANQDIVNYIKDASRHGDSREKIKSNLLAAGWKEADIDVAMKEAPLKKPHPALKAILIVFLVIFVIFAGLLAIGALNYFGFLGPSKTMPEKCVLAPGISCNQFDVTSTSVSLVIGNQLGQDMVLSRLKIGSCEKEFNAPIKAGGIGAFTLIGCNNGQPGSMFSGDITLAYSAGGFSHEMPGQIAAKIKS